MKLFHDDIDYAYEAARQAYADSLQKKAEQDREYVNAVDDIGYFTATVFSNQTAPLRVQKGGKEYVLLRMYPCEHGMCKYYEAHYGTYDRHPECLHKNGSRYEFRWCPVCTYREAPPRIRYEASWVDSPDGGKAIAYRRIDDDSRQGS